MASKSSSVIMNELYKFVSDALDKRSKKYIQNIHTFINDRHEQLFAIAPYENIYFNAKDLEKMYDALGFTEQDVLPICKNIFFWDWPGVNPGCVKEPYILIMLCAIKYYIKNNETKNAELATVYFAFSGKIYASIYGKLWPYSPKNSRQVMDYVINNMITDKFDIKREGNVFSAMKKLCITWMETYKRDLIGRDTDDEDCKVLIQQLRDRVNSLLKNVAKLFYKAVEDKSYMNYETDSLDEDDFHLTDNNAAIAARMTESTMNILISQKVDLSICKICVNENVKSPTEIMNIMETILSDKKNIPQIRRVINIIISDYLSNYKNGRVGSNHFVSYTLQAKPNTKSKILIEMKQTIVRWLDENSPAYRIRKSRPGTANNYYRAVLSFFTFTICKVAQNY